jgi:hypothetical protein
MVLYLQGRSTISSKRPMVLPNSTEVARAKAEEACEEGSEFFVVSTK